MQYSFQGEEFCLTTQKVWFIQSIDSNADKLTLLICITNNNQRMVHWIILHLELLNCIIYFYNRFLVILVFLLIVTQKLMQSLKLRGITISNPFSGHLCYSSGKLKMKLKPKHFIRELDYNHSGQFSISVLVLCIVPRSLVLYLLSLNMQL